MAQKSQLGKRAVFGGVLLGALGWSGVAAAAPLTVNSTEDTTLAGDGKCTLREAIAKVSTGSGEVQCGVVSGAAEITFDLPAGSVITIAAADSPFFPSTDVIITGPGADKLTISGGDNSTIFRSASKLSLSGLEL